jgi:hypothetical protein
MKEKKVSKEVEKDRGDLGMEGPSGGKVRRGGCEAHRQLG